LTSISGPAAWRHSTLPILIRRLILASASVTEISMRAREGTLLPGWDGRVQSNATDAHVPLGRSGWELGTSKNPRDKAQPISATGSRIPWATTPQQPRSWP
jgi:hypothetical protein